MPQMNAIQKTSTTRNMSAMSAENQQLEISKTIGKNTK